MPELIHCSYHRCLTVFYRRVMETSMARFGGFQHFGSDLGRFEAERHTVRIASLNHRALDVESLGDVRVSRFVRDPRDLLVSGYLYHRRGAEPWCRVVDPDPEEWMRVRHRVVPEALAPGESLMDCLQRLDQEEGLLVEMELRRHHLDSMRDWPADDPRVRVWRYEDILGHERRLMKEVALHYELPLLQRRMVQRSAERFDSEHQRAKQDPHLRTSTPGQWRSLFTPRVQREFVDRWGDLLDRYGYAADATTRSVDDAHLPV